MTIVPVLLFCSLLLVAASLVLFVFSARQGDCHEADRLCLLPLDDDGEAPISNSSSSSDSTDPPEVSR